MVRVNTQNTRERNCHRVHIGTKRIVDLSPSRHNGTVGHFIESITITEFIVVNCGVVHIADSVFGGGVINGSVFDGGLSDGGVFDGNVFDRSVFDSGL